VNLVSVRTRPLYKYKGSFFTGRPSPNRAFHVSRQAMSYNQPIHYINSPLPVFSRDLMRTE